MSITSLSPDALRDGLFRLGRVFERVDDLDKMLRAIIEECKLMLRCDAASVALYDAERGDLVFTVASGGSEEGITQWRMNMGQGIVGIVAESREPLYSNDPKSDPRWFGQIDNVSGFITLNLAAVPMIHSGNLVGVVEALNRPDEDFTDEDLMLLQIFADQTAQALEINRLIEAKQESERLATFAVALADIGHSTKNMLMRLEFPIAMIDRSIDCGNFDRMKGSWAVMKQATKEIGTLVRDMLEYSRLRQPEMAEVHVTKMAQSVAAECRPDAESKNIELIIERADADLTWVLDPQILRPSIHNLTGNAIEAIAEHGGSKVTISLEASEKEFRVIVADDGPGIPKEIQRRVFDPFFSTKGKRGTGIGLASVRKGVEEHGGKVILVSEPDQGAEFTLIFPRATLARKSEEVEQSVAQRRLAPGCD
jgi:signal transduction histidine kinase